MNEVQFDPALCREFLENNQEAVGKSRTAGCVRCASIYDAKRIEQFRRGTAVCAHCGGMGSVLPDASAPFDTGFLMKMYQVIYRS